MRFIDLNCDMGEGMESDAELMKYVSSVNVACGYHAGDRDTMKRTVELALENRIAIGAHPGYADKPNLGRTPMALPASEVDRLVTEQILALREICDFFAASLNHVKPHGALYNQAAEDRALAQAIAAAVHTFDPKLLFYGLSGSVMIEEAGRVGLKTASEVFADRTYQSDGSLTPRSQPNALIDTTEKSIEQVLQILRDGSVTALDGRTISLTAETICIHGDGEHAVGFARAIRNALEDNKIEVRPL